MQQPRALTLLSLRGWTSQSEEGQLVCELVKGDSKERTHPLKRAKAASAPQKELEV